MAITQQEIGRRIRAARDACQMAQEDAAKHVGVPPPAFVQIEAGTRPISSLELDRLAYVLGRDVREFVAESFCEQLAAPCAQVDAVARSEALEELRASLAIERELRSLERLVGTDFDPARFAPCAVPSRFLGLALEAFRRDEISRGKLYELASMVGLARNDLDQLLEEAGIDVYK